MNRIRVLQKVNGEYEDIDGIVVSLDTANLLDEQLDEARMVVKESATELFPVLTEIKIEYYTDDTLVDVELFIVGDDKPIEYLN